jgi:hypothetical protein
MSETPPKAPEPVPGEPSAETAPSKRPGKTPKGVRYGGRAKGVPNKKTVEREERERIAREAAANAVAAEAAAEVLERKGTPDTKRAKKVLENFMELFAGMAAVYQPLAPGQRLEDLPPAIAAGRQPDEAKFDKYATLAVETAHKVAPFQDPRYSAMVIGASIVTKIKVEGGMSDDFKPPEISNAPLPALTIIAAEDETSDDEPMLPTKATG